MYSDSAHTPIPTHATCEGEGPTQACSSVASPITEVRSNWALWSGANDVGSMLDMGAKRQFRPGPCPQGAHNLMRKQTMCSTLEPGQNLAPSAPSSVGKAEAEPPKQRRQREAQEKKLRCTDLEMRATMPREAGGTQDKVCQTALDQEVALSGFVNSPQLRQGEPQLHTGLPCVLLDPHQGHFHQP